MSQIIVCDTCGWGEGEKIRDGRAGGEVFAELIESAARQAQGVTVRRVSCLMGCEHPCNAAIQASGKMNYVLGRFKPSQEGAQALVDYAVGHARSPAGVVPYKQWPQGVKGHFIARIPPPEED